MRLLPAFFQDQPQVEEHGEEITCRHADEQRIYSRHLRQKPYAQQRCRRPRKEEGAALFFASERIEYAGGDHGEAHGQQHEAAVADDASAVRVGKEQDADVFSQHEQGRDEKAGDEDGDFDRSFDVFAHLFMLTAVEIFRELGHEHEGKRADERGGNGEYGHAHARGDADLAHRFGAREPCGDQPCRQKEGDGGIYEGVGGAHPRDGQGGGEQRFQLAARVFQPSALCEIPYARHREGDEIGEDDGERGALRAVEHVRHRRHEHDARADHDEFFREVDDAIGDELFVPPESAADDGVYRIEGEGGEQDEQHRHAARVGKEEIEGVVREKEHAEHGHGKEQCADERGGHDGLLRFFVVFCPVLCDQAGYGERDPGRRRRDKHGKDGERDLIDPHALRTERAGEDDAV